MCIYIIFIYVLKRKKHICEMYNIWYVMIMIYIYRRSIIYIYTYNPYNDIQYVILYNMYIYIYDYVWKNIDYILQFLSISVRYPSQRCLDVMMIPGPGGEHILWNCVDNPWCWFQPGKWKNINMFQLLHNLVLHNHNLHQLNHPTFGFNILDTLW